MRYMGFGASDGGGDQPLVSDFPATAGTTLFGGVALGSTTNGGTAAKLWLIVQGAEVAENAVAYVAYTFKVRDEDGADLGELGTISNVDRTLGAFARIEIDPDPGAPKIPAKGSVSVEDFKAGSVTIDACKVGVDIA